MKSIQRIISFLLALVMVIGMMPPIEAHAEETQPTEETTAVETVAEETVVETTAATEETTAPTEAVTEPAEETTAPTEAVTEPTEETISEETAAAQVSGSCGEALTWAWQEGILSVAGTGAMENYTEETRAPWHHLREEIIAVHIADGVTSIGDYAFLDCTGLKSISIPASVTVISGSAFANCGALTDVQYDGTPEQWDSITAGNVVSAVIGFGVSAQSSEDQTPDVGVSEDFLLPIDQITDVEDIPEGFTPIFDEQGLKDIKNNMSGKYILMKDIHIEGGRWWPLWSINGSSDGSFRGELEGNGHTISGMYYNEWSNFDVRFGLFQEIVDAKISNLKVSGGYVVTDIGWVSDYVLLGGLAGDARGNIQILNCVSDMEYNAVTNDGDTDIMVGGLIGRYIGNKNSATIKDCIYLGNTISTQYGGGILGYCELKSNSSLTVENCRNHADIAACEVAGGILGCVCMTNSQLNITKCSNYGNFSCSKWVSPDDIGSLIGHFGGIVGSVSSYKSDNANAFIACCMNSGTIEAQSISGGIAGYSHDTTIVSCVNTGTIKAVTYAGGISGRATNGIIRDCLNTGAVSNNNALAHAGGIAGDGGIFRCCLNIGPVKTPTVSGKAYNSGIVNKPGGTTEEEAEAAIVDCYWLDDGQTNTLYAMYAYAGFGQAPVKEYRTRGRLTAEELLKEESFSGFDFTNVWMMNPLLGHPVPVGIRLPLDLEIEEVGDNKAITLNYSGDTYAYFKSKPDLMYIYTLEGFPNERGTAQAQADGLIRIDLGHYREHGTFEGTITFTAVSPVDSINVVELDQPKTFDIKVTVTPLEFSQKWSVSMDVGAGFSFGPGVEFDLEVPILGSFKGEAALAKLEGSTEKGHAINISRSYSGGKDVLEITSEEADRAKVGVKSGIDGTILKADVDVVSAGTETESTNTGIYGFRIRDFSPDNDVQRNAIGVYLLNEAMKSSPNQLAFQDFLKAQAEKAYKEANLDVISGTGAAVSSSFSAGAGEIKIGHATILEGVKEEGSTTISVGQTKYSDGEKKYTSAFAFDKTFYALRNPQIDGTIAQNYFGKEITLEAQEASGEKALETTSLSAEAGHSGSFTIGREYTTDYNRYRFTEKSLDELTASSAGIRSYLSGNQYAIGDDEIEDVGKLLSKGENPVEYSNVEKKQKLSSHELGFDGQVIIGLELGTTLSFLQENEHTNASGFVVEDRKLETSRSDDLTTKISEKSFTLSKFLSDAVNSLTQKITDFFTQVTGTIKDGAQTLWNWVTGNPDGTVNGIITLCTPSGDEPWLNSHTLEISRTGGKQAATMGRPAIINITDDETGEAITDLSDAPLTFTMRFAAEELAAQDGQMPAMYRCSDDGMYLEYIGGVCNEAEMTVTAEITKPGQYVLAVELHDGSKEDPEEAAAKILLDKDAVILKVGETAQLTAEVQLVELTNNLTWSVSDNSIISIDQDGVVTALKPGTAYAIATATGGETEFTARCRVDVVEPEVEEPVIKLNGVQLGTTKLTTELFSTDYAEFQLLLELPQNVSVMSVDRKNVPEDKGVAIDSIRFTASTTAVAFDLVALDDRRIAVVPTEYALEYPKELAKSYKSAVTVTVDGEEYTTDEILTLTVKQSKPKLKAKIDSFNSFYTGQAQAITIIGGTVTGISAKSLPDWLALNEDFTLSLNENAGTKNSGKAVLLVETAEWNIPAEVTLTVKNAYKAPGLKMSASSVKMTEDAASSTGVELKLLPKSKKDTLASLKVADILAPDGYKVQNFDPDTGTFTLKAENGFQPGKITLNVQIGGTEETVPLTLTVSVQKVSLKLSAKSITLNTALNDSAAVTITATPADYILKDLSIKGNEAGDLDVGFENGILTVATTETTVPNTAYKLSISAGGSKEMTLTVKTVEKTPTVSFKASGNLDLSFPGNVVTVKPTFKNYSGSFTLAETETEHFTLTQDGNTISVRCKDGIEPGSYKLPLELILDDGITVKDTVKITVKRTAVKLKLSSSKLSLNSTINDVASVTVTCTTKGYELTSPIVKVMDKSGKVASNGLDAAYNNGKLTVSVNENTEYGATYKVLVQADADAPAVTLTVSILKENKSAITASLKAKGSIDVIRDGTAITLTPSYKNASNLTEKVEKLVFFKTVKKETTPADDLFTYVRNTDGTYTITKAEGAALDHSAKYTVKLVSTIGSTEVESKTISLTVKQGSAKLTLKSGSSILFAKDKYSRVNFTLTAADAALNGIKTVESKDSRFVVYNYGNGEFALGFANNTVDEKLKGKTVTVTLNIFLEGNETAKANTTAKLKVTILK